MSSTIAITFIRGIRLNAGGRRQSLAPAGEEASVCQDRGRTGPDRVQSCGRDLLAVTGGFPLFQPKEEGCWVWVVVRGGLAVGGGGVEVPSLCSGVICEAGDPPVCPAVLGKEEMDARK